MATVVALNASRILYVGSELTLESARKLVGTTLTMPTLMANETATYTIESISQNRETGDIFAWVTRPGVAGGTHAHIVAKS